MYPLHNTKRCALFEKIASDTWHHVIENHRVDVQVNEPGQTNDIIAEIRSNYLSYPNIGVWANNGYREIDFGSDIDIFVETTPGKFVWWALQAKVLRLNGKYEGMSNHHGNEYQWDKLNRLARLAGCKVRYLLYNGVAGYNRSGIDSCKREFNADQLGCSLVKTKDVERIALLKSPKFTDFHPSPAQPWRIITCCPHYIKNKLADAENEFEKITYYSILQIKNALEYYPEISGNKEIILEDEVKKTINELPVNAINSFSESIARKPAFRLVVRTTSSLSNPK